MRPQTIPALAAALLSAALLGTSASTRAAEPGAAEPAGHVATLHGRAQVERSGAPLRDLRCGDAVLPGDRVLTGEGARVGLVVGEVFAHVGQQSALRLHEELPAADLSLERGAVRVIDPRESGPAGRLRVLDTQARVVGNDVEGYVFTEKTGGYAMMCEWDAPLPVARGPESLTARPGQCAIAKRREPLYLSQGHDRRLGSPSDDVCPIGSVIGAIDLHLSPSDVAAAPVLDPWSDVPKGLDFPRRSPCDVPGSGCGTIIEVVPTGGPVPGGTGPLPPGGVPGGAGIFPGP